MVHLLRASAGAGKTHQLVQIYLTYILAHPAHIPHVVVLSFTNKATQELKQRILLQLHRLEVGEQTAMSEALQAALSCDAQTLAVRAGKALSYLLNRYHTFAIYTVDGFFQLLLRAFSNEIGLSTAYQLILQKNQLLDTCVAELLQQLPHMPQMQASLTALALQKIEEGKGWHFTKELTRWGEEVLGNLSQAAPSVDQPVSPASTSSLELLDQLGKQAAEQVDTLAGMAAQALGDIAQAGFEASDFAWGERGVIGFLHKLKSKARLTPLSSRTRKAGQEASVWAAKRSTNHAAIIRLVEEKLLPILTQIIATHDTHYPRYATVRALLPLRHLIGVTSNLTERLLAYTHTHAAVLIHTVPQLIQRALQGSQAGALYAQTGFRYHHFLVDEFQDLSTAQWEALAPLLEETLKAQKESWLVGDAKQSIYRWRGGNPQLLLGKVAQRLGEGRTHAQDLPYNWRSKPAIISFNNAFFAQAARLLSRYLQADLGAERSPTMQALRADISHIEAAYAQVKQSLPPTASFPDPGYVQVAFIPSAQKGNQWKEASMQETLARIEALQLAGYRAADICLLVRNNAEAQMLLQALLTYKKSPNARAGICYDAVAQAALSLVKNPHINLLVYALRYLHTPEDTLVRATLMHMYQQHVVPLVSGQSGRPSYDYFLSAQDIERLANYLPAEFLAQEKQLRHLSLAPLVAKLIDLFSLDKVASSAYVNAFQAVIHRFCQQSEHSLCAFLAWWEKYGAKEVAPVPAGDNLIRIMTVHQSKGLAFKTVIVPFCGWDLDHSTYNPPIVWGKATEAPFDQLETLPLYYASHLKDTYYAAPYGQERWQQYLEQLNLLYVAFTRAEEGLYVLTPDTASAKGVKNTAHLLKSLLVDSQEAATDDFLNQGSWDAEAGIWEAGHMPVEKKEEKSDATTESLESPAGMRTYVDPGQHRQLTHRVRAAHQEGVWWHELLAQLKTVEEVAPTLAYYVATQQLSATQAKEVREKLARLFSDPRMRDWFSKAWQIYAERSIMQPNGSLWRPDRVMTQGKKAVVLDFKLGEALSSHHAQVHRYMELLEEAGYEEVRGYLLYIGKEAVVEVSDSC